MKIFPTADSYPESRLFSLDLLRGLDIFFLTCACGLFSTAHTGLGLFSDGVMRQFLHCWGVFHLIDIVMPMFIFMCGCAVPLALARRLSPEGRPTAAFWKHVALRFLLLWFCGLVAQGRLLSLDWRELSPFNNTLETIACGYVIAALAMLIPNRKIQIAMPFALAALYAVPMAIYGDYSPADALVGEGGLLTHPEGSHIATTGFLVSDATGEILSKGNNLAWIAETKILNWILPAGSNVFAHRDPGYTWFATIPMFGVMTLCGAESTRILMDKARSPMARFWRLFALGAALLAVGWALLPWIPAIKHLYTFTFVAQAMGWCMLSLSICFLASDVFKFRKGLGLFILFGQFALTAYMLADTCFAAIPAAAAKTACCGFPRAFGQGWATFLTYAVQCVVLTGVLVFRYNLRSLKSEVRNLKHKG
ncbi:MAG: hypothetical protein MJ138_01690 [Kiritimatiellae bacterium]|nr:hypothetical protein [Kiritimatiellia bacterium]